MVFTSFSVSWYSLTFSTATMLVSTSEDILTSQFREAVSWNSGVERRRKSYVTSLYKHTGSGKENWFIIVAQHCIIMIIT